MKKEIERRNDPVMIEFLFWRRHPARCSYDNIPEMTPRLTVLKTAEPPVRPAGRRLASVAELVDCLKTEAGVL